MRVHALSMLAALGATLTVAAAQTAPPPKAPPINSYVVRGCLKGSTLTAIEPTQPPLKLPEKLKATSTRVIRDQLKALDGHRVEITGALFGVPGIEEGVVVGDSGTMRVVVGGRDPNITDDMRVDSGDPPFIRATMIKELAPSCTAP